MITVTAYSPESIQAIKNAIDTLAANCDGALTRDTVGFNGTDTKYGKRVSALPVSEWSEDILIISAHILRKYAGQLMAYGIDIIPAIEDIMSVVNAPGEPDMQAISENAHHEAWQKEYDRSHAPKITIENGTIKVLNSFKVKDELKANGFRFTGWSKSWDAPVNSISAHAVLGIPAIILTDEQREYLSSFPAPVIEPTEERINITVKPGSTDTLILWTPSANTIPLTVTRAIPGRQWSAANGVNYISALPSVIELANQYGLTITDEAIALIETKRAAVEAIKANAAKVVAASLAKDTDDMSMAFANRLRAYQRAGVVYATDENREFAGRTLFGDEMGLGKTWQALSTVETEQKFPALIICPSSLVLNWAREINELIPHRTVEIYTFRMKGNGFMLGDADITIMPYGVVDSFTHVMPQWKAVICDESHYIKNPKAKRTAALLQIFGRGFSKDGSAIPASVTEDAYRILMTGTPILNRPIELVEQLRALGILSDHPSASVIGSVAWFKYSFCNPQPGYMGRVTFNGCSNPEGLHMWLREKCMIRRSKSDVLTELPPKIRSFQPIELNKAARATYERLAQEGAEKAAESRAEALVYLNALRMAIGESKIDMAIEWITEFIETGKSLIVFANHVKVQHAVINALREAGINVTHILGGQSQVMTENHKREFQAGNSPVIVLSLNAAREGHTLTAASDVLFIEQGWNPGTHNQAEDRAHRIGQTDTVTAWYMIGLDTIDEWLYELIAEKRKVCDAVNDGSDQDDNDESLMMAVLDTALGKYGVKRRF